MRLRVIASVLAGCSALWLNIPAFAYGSFAFPGHGNKPDWIRACKCADQGVALAAQKKYKEALEFYDKANAIYPTAMTYYDRANTLFALKRLKESIESHKRAIEIAPEFWQPYCNIGDIYRINGAQLSKTNEAVKAGT